MGHDAVFQHRIGPLVRGRPEQEIRVRRQGEGLRRQPEMFGIDIQRGQNRPPDPRLGHRWLGCGQVGIPRCRNHRRPRCRDRDQPRLHDRRGRLGAGLPPVRRRGHRHHGPGGGCRRHWRHRGGLDRGRGRLGAWGGRFRPDGQCIDRLALRLARPAVHEAAQAGNAMPETSLRHAATPQPGCTGIADPVTQIATRHARFARIRVKVGSGSTDLITLSRCPGSP